MVATRMYSSLTQAQSNTNRVAVLQTYRSLLRATRIAFSGDRQTFDASRKAVRDSFSSNKLMTPNSTVAAQALEHAQGVAKILRENVVQGRQVKEDHYKLNIHEHTERGDNDTAGKLKGTRKSFKEIKDSTP